MKASINNENSSDLFRHKTHYSVLSSIIRIRVKNVVFFNYEVM